MGNIDEGRLQALMQFGDLGAHLHTELRVQVGERFVHQEDLRIADDRATQGDALTLAAGERLRLTVEKLLDAQNLRGLANELVDLVLRLLAQLQAERHVVINGHVRIERVVLEDHRDIAILRRHVVHQTVADVQFAFRNLFKTRDHTERRGLAAAGRTDQNDELLVLDIQAEVGNSGHVAGVNLVDVVKLQARHSKIPLVHSHTTTSLSRIFRSSASTTEFIIRVGRVFCNRISSQKIFGCGSIYPLYFNPLFCRF